MARMSRLIMTLTNLLLNFSLKIHPQPESLRACFEVRFKCPVCGYYLRHMNPFGINPRPDAECPVCFSLERHRLLWLFLKQRTDFFKTRLKVLHFAPEPVLQERFRAMPNLDYLSVDKDSRIADKRMDITDLSLPGDFYDVILCFHVLEHVVEDRRAMRELFRVLKPGGLAILQVPIRGEETLEDENIVSPEDRTRFYERHDHVRLYGAADFRSRLEQAGFDVRTENYAEKLGRRKTRFYSLGTEGTLYLCSKGRSSERVLARENRLAALSVKIAEFSAVHRPGPKAPGLFTFRR